ncbi:MAG: SpoIIE family protein phosphatase [Firmicutes bacterium]|nr:SpoIIE family protein phosphatase [Bacillota bacterium]
MEKAQLTVTAKLETKRKAPVFGFLKKIAEAGVKRDAEPGRKYAEAFSKLSALFSEAASEPFIGDAPSMLERIAQRCCSGCGLFCYCYGRDIKRTHSALIAGVSLCRKRGFASRNDLPLSFLENCVAPESVLFAINRECELMKRDELWHGRFVQSRELLKNCFDIMSQLPEQDKKERKCKINVLPGVASKSADGAVCGDYIAFHETGRIKYALIADGMGTGAAALAESERASKLFFAFLAAGFSPEPSLKLINSALCSLGGAESFTTMDLCAIDCAEGIARFIKAGAPPSFLLRRGAAKTIAASALPVGIIPEAAHSCQILSVKPNDLIVLASDGFFEAVGEGEFPEGLGRLSPSGAASRLLAMAEKTGRIRDDVSIAVLKIV